MNELYQWNRTRAESYKKELLEQIQNSILPEEFAEFSDSDSSPGASAKNFCLEYKSRIKDFIDQRVLAHKKELEESDNTHLILLKQTGLVDVVVQHSFSVAVWFYNRAHSAALKESEVPLCIAARGGYGREETFFSSDVDLQLLAPPLPEDGSLDCVRQIMDHFNYLFTYQDIFPTASAAGFCEVGMEETIDVGDMARFYGMMEGRYVAGDLGIFNQFKSAVKTASLMHKEKILSHCLENRLYFDVANTVFQQEPNIKEELRRLYWALSLTRLRQGRDTLNQFELLYELYQDEIISGAAFKHLQKSLNFLCRMRLFLHGHQPVAQKDLLSYEVREKIAQSMGFELFAFYREYFYNVAYPLKRYSRNLFWESMVYDNKPTRTLAEPFAVNKGNQIICKTDPGKVLEERPVFLFKIFVWVAERGCYLSYPVIRAIERNVDQVCPVFMNPVEKKEIETHFHNIIRGKFFARALRLLHEFGLLSNFYIPEFKNLCGLLQDIYVHVFPTDVHILAALDQLNGLDLDPDANPFLSQLYQSVKDKTAMKLSVLLHDIGKGMKKAGENEELVGSRLIPSILDQLGLADKRKRVDDVAFLVQKHLQMRDLMMLDPEEDETYEMIWDLVNQDPERLKMLILLTFADRGGTKMKMSASQIDQLKLFYQQTLHRRKRSKVPLAVKSEFIKMARLPRNLQFQLEVFNNFARGGQNVVMDIFFEPDGPSELAVCTRDSRSLLYKMAAVLAFNQLHILEAEIHTLGSKAFDVFKIFDQDGKPLDFSNLFFLKKKVREDLDRLFAQGKSLADVYRGNTLATGKIPGSYNDIKFKLGIIGRAVKLESQDILGNFMMQTHVFSEFNMEIQRAVLHAQHGSASNVFYVRPKDVEWIMQHQETFEIRMQEALGSLFQPGSIFLEDAPDPPGKRPEAVVNQEEKLWTGLTG